MAAENVVPQSQNEISLNLVPQKFAVPVTAEASDGSKTGSLVPATPSAPAVAHIKVDEQGRVVAHKAEGPLLSWIHTIETDLAQARTDLKILLARMEKFNLGSPHKI